MAKIIIYVNNHEYRRFLIVSNREEIMITTYPLHKSFYGPSGKKSDPEQSRGRFQKNASGRRQNDDHIPGGVLNTDQKPQTAFGSFGADKDDYHLGRLIYML